MKYKSSVKSNLLLVLTVFIVFVVVMGMVTIGNVYVRRYNVVSDDAVFNLSQVDFDNGKSTYLSGNWEFYYNSLIISDNKQDIAPSAFLDVPSSWSHVVTQNNNFQSGGYASYKCTLTSVHATQPLTIYVPNISCAYNIYINGTLVSVSGVVSDDSTAVQTSAAHESVPFVLEPDTNYEVVIEVAADNYSGLYMPVYISNYVGDTSYINIMTSLRFALSGIIFFCALLFIIFKQFINKDLYSLWLPVLCIILFLRMVITTEGYAVTQPLFHNMNYEIMNIFIFISTFIIKLVSLIYLTKCLKIKASDSSFVIFSTIFLILAVGINFLPNSIFDIYYYVILQMTSFVIDMYIVNKLCIEIVKKTEYSLLYLLSYLFIIVGLMVDTLYVSGIIPFRCSSFMPVCFFIFVLLTAIIHALRIKKLYLYALESQSLKSELEQANMSIMLSQIQPHFLYNALNTIKSLIKRDPKKAEAAVIDFSLYLRGNMDSLSKTDPIVFKEELDHIKYYCNIEQLRFQDKLEIYYDIGPDSFYVPTLSIQPIVENAIKHGVTKKPEGGSVTISTYENEQNYFITVEDDGIGFDINEATQKNDGKRSHVGIKNISDRLKNIMGAEVTIDSVIGSGTKVTVRLPKEKNVKTIQESLELNDKNNIFREMDI